MARFYVLKDVTIPSSFDYAGGNPGSHLVVSTGFNSANCKPNITYTVLVNGVFYDTFSLTQDAVDWILAGLSHDGEEYCSATLPCTGDLSLEPVDWDANSAPAGWRWTGTEDAQVSIYFEGDGKYFENTELNSLWNELVTTVTDMQLSAEWRITPIPPIDERVDGWCEACIIDGYYLSATANAYELYEPDENEEWMWLLGFSANEPLELSILDRTKTYFIGRGTVGNGDAYLRYEPLVMEGTGSVKDVHDFLVKVLGLRRDTEPESIADYLKGLSVCARYIGTGELNTTSKSTLAEIVAYLKSAKICPECGKLITAAEYITRHTTVGTTDYYHFDCAKNVDTADPSNYCTDCDKHLNVYEEYTYNGKCETCVTAD